MASIPVTRYMAQIINLKAAAVHHKAHCASECNVSIRLLKDAAWSIYSDRGGSDEESALMDELMADFPEH